MRDIRTLTNCIRRERRRTRQLLVLTLAINSLPWIILYLLIRNL